jgi:hypothetical protein
MRLFQLPRWPAALVRTDRYQATSNNEFTRIFQGTAKEHYFHKLPEQGKAGRGRFDDIVKVTLDLSIEVQ